MAAIFKGSGQHNGHQQHHPQENQYQQVHPGMGPQMYEQMPGSQGMMQQIPIGSSSIMTNMGSHPSQSAQQQSHMMMRPETPPDMMMQHGQVQMMLSESSASGTPIPSGEEPVLTKFGFFRGLTEKKTTRDGQTPKRRGPKPDSKPALTRRQELNRQAQRTHRERKEMYIRALEQEVLKLKELFESVCLERDAYRNDNARLLDLIGSHGISLEYNSPMPSHNPQIFDDGSTGSYGAANTESTRFTSPPQMYPSAAHLGASPQIMASMVTSNGQIPTSLPTGLDYDQIGIDLVLTLERPCMDHIQFLMVRSSDSDGEISGHVLMATCPPGSHIDQNPGVPYPHQMPSLGMKDLTKLLDLSGRLPLDGEITPIMAWSRIIQDSHMPELDNQDFIRIRDDLLTKVRCYGFGAVLEEFEVRDAIESALIFKAKAKLAKEAAEAAAAAAAIAAVIENGQSFMG